MLRRVLTTIFELLTELLKLTVFILTVLLAGYFIIVNIVNSLFPEITSKNLIITTVNSDLNRILIGLMGILGAMIVISLKRKELKFISPFSLTKEETIILGLSSYFLAYFIKENLIALIFIKKIFLVILTLIFFVFLPQILNYYLQFNLNFLNKLLKNIKNELITIKAKPFNWRVIYKIFPYMLVLTILLTVILFVVAVVSWQINKYLAYQSDLRRRLVITKIKPKVTTIGEKVTLEGYNFGFKENEFFQVQTNFGQATDIKDWNNNKVEFIIPLSFKEGQIKLWLERTKEASTKSALLKSNQVDFEILSRWYFYPQAEEFSYPPSFFTWVKTLKKRIRRIILLKYNWTNFIE